MSTHSGEQYIAYEPKLPAFRGDESSKSDDASDNTAADNSLEGGDDADNDRRLLTIDAQGTSNSTKPQAPSTIVAKAKPVVVAGRKLLQQATNNNGKQQEGEDDDDEGGRKLLQEGEDDDDDDGRELLQEGDDDDDDDGRKLL